MPSMLTRVTLPVALTAALLAGVTLVFYGLTRLGGNGERPPPRAGTDSPSRASHSAPPASPAGGALSPGPTETPQKPHADHTEGKQQHQADSGDDRGKPEYRQAALRFTRAYTSTDRAKRRWMADIARLSTRELARGLSYTDLAVVPDSPPAGDTTVSTRGELHITLRVPLESGGALLVTLKPGDCPGGWCADRVAPGDTS